MQCSSVLGLVALKWRGAYNASKFAIEALSDTMRLELRGSGIFVSLIEPGPITSKFVETSLQELREEHRRGIVALQGGLCQAARAPRPRRHGALQAGAGGGAGEAGSGCGNAPPPRALLCDEADAIHGDRTAHPAAADCWITCSTRRQTSNAAWAECRLDGYPLPGPWVGPHIGIPEYALFFQYLSYVATAAVAVVLLMGLANMFRRRFGQPLADADALARGPAGRRHRHPDGGSLFQPPIELETGRPASHLSVRLAEGLRWLSWLTNSR